jgi:hypothetical protein
MLAGLTLFLLNNSNLDEIPGLEKVRIEEINIPCSVTRRHWRGGTPRPWRKI